MDLNTAGFSPKEEGELEDGEICDDETEESEPLPVGDGSRPGRAPPRPHKHPRNLLPHMALPQSDFRLMMPYNHGPHGHGPFPPIHRQQCGPSGPDRPPVPSPPTPPGHGPHCEPSPRSNFWERSHGTLGRFRQRAMPNGGRGGWNRGGWGSGNARPMSRYGPAENHGNKKDSPPRKQKQAGRNQARKPAYSVAKSENGVDETFEDLLSKYKQIQLELECIRKEETMALEPQAPPARDNAPPNAAGITETRTAPETASVQSPAATEEGPGLDRSEKKVFQAFNIKPLRQKLPTPAELDALKKKPAEQQEDGDGETEGDEGRTKPECTTTEHTPDQEAEAAASKFCGESSPSSEEDVVFVSTDKPVVRVEEEELSELQLRLLALQSASKKWQQKEQQVMKESKDRITKASQEKTSSAGPAAVAPPSRQRVTTRSASSAAALERSRTRSKPLERDRDRPKAGARSQERDRDRPNVPDRERPKPGPKSPLERGRTPAKPHQGKKLISPGSVAKQAFRKQQVRTWKQQQREEETRRQEEEERRKREDEIRRIRDLSNQDEQYNRFMKLVGGKTKMRSESRDREHRKSTGKQGLDTSGNLYQYDNYDEVAMDTDSETGSPVPSPTHNPFAAEDPACLSQMPLYLTDSSFRMDFAQPFLSSALSGVPPPPPPLPPPLDDSNPPPKPPFADEEEEEEMLLRETCLMSMANKREATKEENTSSPPPLQPAAGLQPPPRGNLSTVNLNTVTQSRTNKFHRARHVPRAPLVLPRHKSVVVSLNDSDDSDSDMDACSSMQTVFGGLEFMIKEARRTVEAAKPKGASASEKENNPVRTPEALPEAKKVEYRLLKEEIASREKQKMVKEHGQLRLNAASDSVLHSAARPAAELKLKEAEEKLSKHRELLQKDEAILRQLIQQELKKRESLKAAEGKVARLKEQLLASEKIVNANKTLLKKLQEQVHRVEHRVSIKKSQIVKFQKEVAQARLAAGRVPKRKQDSNQLLPRKLQRVDGSAPGSERHFAELIAQKQRLQQLEAEYALKIQKLKEAQALRHRGAASEPPSEPLPVRTCTPPPPQNQPPPPPTSPFSLPQPSLHDLTQDKLTLDSEDVPEGEDHESESTAAPTAAAAASSAAAPAAAAAATATGTRRRSSSSFTKPNLDQVASTPTKDNNAAKPSKAATASREPSEMFAGLDMDTLKQRYQQQDQLGELLLRELQKVGEAEETPPAGKVQLSAVEVDAVSSHSGGSELKLVPFEPYHSSLLVFRSYRFSPYYRTKEKLALSSVTYSNAIEPKKCFCRFDLTGTCNDDGCRWLVRDKHLHHIPCPSPLCVSLSNVCFLFLCVSSS
ncbi:zinc finger C3H1 domain-containing protein-like, partial [Genypterus blacodes]|uniref:zinc finger C3H1 domain-containing protein-like n=1 Tax=Genypterus blacodes TaxID=154954 RepID=UPI003F763579